MPSKEVHVLLSKKVNWIDKKEKIIDKRRFNVESIVAILREADVMIGKGMTLSEILRQLNISDATYYKWRKEYGGLKVDQAKRYKGLETKNQRLKKCPTAIMDVIENIQVSEREKLAALEMFIIGAAIPYRVANA